MASQPPPLMPQRPPTVEYHQPAPAGTAFDTGGSDGVVGINLRWKDNFYQLLAGIVGGLLGGMSGFVLALHSILFSDAFVGIFIGAVAGLFTGVVAWGAFLGIYYFVRRRQSKKDG
jgi:hypothetical protein